jgi:hypothetical protein
MIKFLSNINNINTDLFKKSIIIIISIFLLQGCDSFKGFKRSANNKIIDNKGFQGAKRKPLYNKKYIEPAKKNIYEENFDDDIDDEEAIDSIYEAPNQTSINKQMYINMIKQDAKRKQSQRLKDYTNDPESKVKKQDYPSLVQATQKIKENDNNNEAQDLRAQLLQVQSVLNEVKKDLGKYRCPNVQQSEVKELVKEDTNNIVDKQETIINPIKPKSKFLHEREDYQKINLKNHDMLEKVKIDSI